MFIFSYLTPLKKEADRTPIYNAVKRVFDMVLSLAFLIAFAPLFLLIALAIKADSKGPVFFKQLRAGYLCKPFWILKFRTMYDGADRDIEKVIPLQKVSKGDRSTRVGAFLRRHKLDELPQLVNVLKGEMSLIGPRPLRLSDSTTTPPKYLMRFSVKPGMTGLWQATLSSDIPGEKKIELDHEYVRRRSLLLDMKLFFKTIPILFRGE